MVNENLTSLPKNWYVRVTDESSAIIYKEFFKTKHRDGHAWAYCRGYPYGYIDEEYTASFSTFRGQEISLDQFRRWVLGYMPATSEDRLGRAKREYPIGTKISGINTKSNYEVVGGWQRYGPTDIICDTNINKTFLFKDGKWADKILSESQIQRALRTYLNSTKFKSPENGKVYTVDYNSGMYRETNGFYEGSSGGSILCHTKETNNGEYLYYNGKWAEIVKEVPTEGNLEKAKRLYPIGTRYMPLNQTGNPYGEIQTCAIEPEPGHEGRIFTVRSSAGGYVYANGKWADIVNHTERVESPSSSDEESNLKKAIQLYPIGTYYKPLNASGNVIESVFEVKYKPKSVSEGMGDMIFGSEVDGSGFLYAKGIWAEIIPIERHIQKALKYEPSSEQLTPQESFKQGDSVFPKEPIQERIKELQQSKTTDLEFQQPVLVKKKSTKSKQLFIINI